MVENQRGYGIRLLAGKPLSQSKPCVRNDYVNLEESPKLKIEIDFQVLFLGKELINRAHFK